MCPLKVYSFSLQHFYILRAFNETYTYLKVYTKVTLNEILVKHPTPPTLKWLK